MRSLHNDSVEPQQHVDGFDEFHTGIKAMELGGGFFCFVFLNSALLKPELSEATTQNTTHRNNRRIVPLFFHPFCLCGNPVFCFMILTIDSKKSYRVTPQTLSNEGRGTQSLLVVYIAAAERANRTAAAGRAVTAANPQPRCEQLHWR